MTRRLPSVPGAVVAGLALAVVLDTLIQVAWKLAVADIPPGASLSEATVRVLANGWFYVAMLGFGAQLVNWLRVLAQADLSYAQPFTALSYVTVLAISHRLLGEPLTTPRLVGVALILLGVYLISRTPVRTEAVGIPAHPVQESGCP